MTLRGEAYDAAVREHLKLLWWSRKTPQKELARAIGDVYPCQVTRRLDGETRIKPRDLSAMLATLGVDEQEFYDGIKSGFHAEFYLARIASNNGRQKKYASTDLMADTPSKPYTADELREVAAGLRDLRITDPEAARVRALDVLRAAFHHGVDAGDESLFEASIGLAAVYRTRGSYGTAAAFLLKALYLAGVHGRMKARVLHETVPLAVSLGDFEAGLRAAELALSEFGRLGDFQSQGRVLISKGNLLGQGGRLDEAVDAYRKSLPVIAEDRWYQRFAALHGLGLCYMLKGEPSNALKYADRSVTALDCETVPPLQEAEARWLRGEILSAIGSSRGIGEFLAVLDIYSNENVSDTHLALISLRLIVAYLEDGQTEEARELTTSLTQLLRRRVRKKNKVLAGVLAELESMAIRGELSRGSVQRIYRMLLKADTEAPRAAHLSIG